MKADEARLHLEAADNFTDIAEVKAEGREENLHRAIGGVYKSAPLLYFGKKQDGICQNPEQRGHRIQRSGRSQGQRKNLTLAVNAYSEALKIYSLDAFPVDYAVTKANLGNALIDQGDRKGFIQCHTEALEIFEKEGMGDYAKKEKALLEKMANSLKKPKK